MNHKCLACKQEYPLRIEDNVATDKDGKNIKYEDFMDGFAGFHQAGEHFWNSPVTKQKIQTYRIQFSKYFDYNHLEAEIHAVLKSNLTLELADKCLKEIISVPVVDTCILLEAITPQSIQIQIEGEGGSIFGNKSLLIKDGGLQSKIDGLRKPSCG